MATLPTQLGLLLMSLFPLGLLQTARAQTPAETGTDEGPRTAVEGYFMAHALGRGEFITQNFAPDAKIQFVEDGQLKVWMRDEFAKRFQQPAADEYRRVRRVERLDVSGTGASAVVTLNYPQVLFCRSSLAAEN
jgi:hypothetical protein